ncbi:MAG: NUDIX domain-containing protein [Thermomicrobiales bacterium]|nr:NUDIX domain-containing protein [Thermomicrobiales bacterium]MCO5224200.1 NUDIX domain-containing protein [Thermomicrobiales bacterium]
MSDQLPEAIVETLKKRPEVTAIWLAGSRGRGTNDEYSDIDIWVAIDDDAIAEVVADPLAYVHEITPTIMHVVAPEIAPSAGAFVGSWIPWNAGACQVDWYLVPAGSAARMTDTRLVYGDVPLQPEEPVELLSPEEVSRKVRDHLILGMLMVSNVIKHGRRQTSWGVTNSARNADAVIVKARWYLGHQTEPDYVAMKQTVLVEPAVLDDRGVREIASYLLVKIEQLASAAGLAQDLEAPVSAMREEIARWRSEGGFVTETGLQILSEAEFYASLPRRRVASGLFITNAADEILLLETTYKPQWETPGGLADAGESPRETAAREVIEEIGLAIAPGDLLTIQHIAASAPRGDMLVYLYDGGVIDDPTTIAVDAYEIRAAHFVPLDRVADHTVPVMTERLYAAMRARKEGRLIEVSSDTGSDHA